MADVIGKLRATLRAAIGLPQDPGQPPDLMRLGLYRSTVVSCAADGSACDVQPEDSRIAGAKNVPVRVGVPGLTAIVRQGAIVLLGWERGDPSRPYCVPAWEPGAPVTKLAFSANTIELAGNSSAAILDTLLADLSAALGTIAATNLGGTILTDPTKITALTSKVTSGAYKSTKVKNG